MTRKAVEKPAIAPERLDEIRASIDDWEAGKWAIEVNYGPACTCGLRKVRECERHRRTPVEE